MTSPFYNVLKDIAEQKAEARLHLAQGGAKSYEEYREMVGAYRALDGVEFLIKEQEQRYIED